MILTIILIWITTMMSIGIGIAIGMRLHPESVRILKESIEKRFKKDDLPPGPIIRPSQDTLDMRADPKAYEGVKETKKAFDELLGEDGNS